MVDAKNRAMMAAALGDYVGGRINSGEFDNRIDSAAQSNDRGLFEIFLALWSTYDDFKDRPFYGEPIAYARFKRCVAFLRSDLEYAYPRVGCSPLAWFRKTEPKPGSWPFHSQAQWRAHRRLAADFPAPGASVAIAARALLYPKPAPKPHYRSFRLGP